MSQSSSDSATSSHDEVVDDTSFEMSVEQLSEVLNDADAEFLDDVITILGAPFSKITRSSISERAFQLNEFLELRTGKGGMLGPTLTVAVQAGSDFYGYERLSPSVQAWLIRARFLVGRNVDRAIAVQQTGPLNWASVSIDRAIPARFEGEPTQDGPWLVADIERYDQQAFRVEMPGPDAVRFVRNLVRDTVNLLDKQMLAEIEPDDLGDFAADAERLVELVAEAVAERSGPRGESST